MSELTAENQLTCACLVVAVLAAGELEETAKSPAEPPARFSSCSARFRAERLERVIVEVATAEVVLAVDELGADDDDNVVSVVFAMVDVLAGAMGVVLSCCGGGAVDGDVALSEPPASISRLVLDDDGLDSFLLSAPAPEVGLFCCSMLSPCGSVCSISALLVIVGAPIIGDVAELFILGLCNDCSPDLYT